MMQLRSIISAGFLSFFSLACAAQSIESVSISPTNNHRIAIQGVIVTGGDLGIGVVDYMEKTEIGLTLSGKINNASQQTKTITPAIFGGLRKLLSEQTYFAYGLDLAATYGKDHGVTINSNYQVGPYISLEQMLTKHVMLTGFIQPYQYQYEKKGGVSTSTNSFFSTGGIAISYLF